MMFDGADLDAVKSRNWGKSPGSFKINREHPAAESKPKEYVFRVFDKIISHMKYLSTRPDESHSTGYRIS